MTAMRFEQVQRFILAQKNFGGYGHFKARNLLIYDKSVRALEFSVRVIIIVDNCFKMKKTESVCARSGTEFGSGRPLPLG